jgi:hypothetical protein
MCLDTSLASEECLCQTPVKTLKFWRYPVENNFGRKLQIRLNNLSENLSDAVKLPLLNIRDDLLRNTTLHTIIPAVISECRSNSNSIFTSFTPETPNSSANIMTS